MARIIKFPISEEPVKLGFKKVRKSRRINLEDFGQLNMFDQQTKVIALNTHDSYFEQALYFDEQGDELAKEYYWKAIKAGESVADAYCNLGIIESEIDNVKAIDCFTKCLKEDPRHFEAHYNLANIYSEAGNLDLAKMHYNLAIKLEPDFGSAYYNLGLVLALKEEYEEAIDVLVRFKMMANDDQLGHANKLIETLKRTVNN
ncbi:MAG TPA: tetratricopeptide repeat protein [Fulvivirga sp.]|nr:tetratricopeptide repeat protein [Fulvivirga sp.]